MNELEKQQTDLQVQQSIRQAQEQKGANQLDCRKPILRGIFKLSDSNSSVVDEFIQERYLEQQHRDERLSKAHG